MILVFTLCVLATLFGYMIYKKISNPCSIFFLLWAILVVFSKMGLYGINVPSANTYLLLFIGLLSFFIGFILGMPQKKHSITVALNDQINKKINADTEYILNKKILLVLYVITFLYLIYQSYIVINMMRSGLDLSMIRELSTSTDYNILRSSNFMIAIQNFITTPTVYLAIAILPIEWFRGNRNKILIISTLLMVVTWVLTTGGRSIIIWFLIYVIYLYKWSGKKIELKKKKKLIIFIVVIVSVVGLVVATTARKGENTDFFFQIYQYFVAPISHFEYRINQLNSTYSGIKGYGIASYYGLLYPFMFVFNLFGWEYPELITTIRYLSFTNLEEVVTLGNVRMNAFVTTFFHFYLDGGIFGIIFGSILFGYFAMFFYRKSDLGRNCKYTLIYLLIFQKLIFSFVRFYFTQPIQGISFILAFFLYQKVCEDNNK